MEAELITEEIFVEVTQECKIIPLKPSVARMVSRDFSQNSGKIQRTLSPIKEHESELCLALWRGVVMQAIYDISATASDYEKKIIKTNAYSWFSSDDFHLVCELAQMNPKQILDLVRLIRCGRVQVQDSKTFKIKRQ